MKKYKYSDFPVTGDEVDKYCYSFAVRYGENSAVFKAVDEEYSKAKSIDGTWCSFLNDLRERLEHKGFAQEVKQQDMAFGKEMVANLSAVNKHSGKTVRETRKAYIPINKP